MTTSIIMYVIPLCPYCKRAKKFLTEKGISFEERNILFNKAYRQEFEKVTDVRTVPVTVFGNQVVVGYNPNHFESALANLKLE